MHRPKASLRTRLASLLVAGTLLPLGLSCTTNPYTGEPELSKTAIGALLGAGLGAAIGAATGDNGRERKKRALIGAGAGALAGGAIGAYMDYQEAELRKRLERTGVGIERDGDEIRLIMPGNVTFETDSSDLRPDFFDVLDSVALVLNEYNQTLIEVGGHTDSTGSHEYNLDLSGQRATTVARYLRGREVYPERLLVLAFGETEPIAPNSTAQGRQENRRVEITIVPLTDD